LAKDHPRTSPAANIARLRFQTPSGFILLLLVLIAATLIWMRNRDILSDTYDYSSLITAAGKVEAGLKPYVDFRSTMQSACYVLTRTVEVIAGRNYLALTWGGLALSLGGALALAALLWRQFGPRLAAALVGAITLAGFSPHVIIFYNPLGILCLAIVVIGLADGVPPQPWRSWRIWLVALALVVGGTNKINFQALMVGLASLSLLRAWISHGLSGRGVIACWGGLLLCGVAIPLGLELVWTGASLQQWYFNVVELAEARVGFVALALSPQAYLEPTYTLHHHVLFKPLHTVGLGVLLVVTVAAWRQISLSACSRSHLYVTRLVLGLSALAAGIGGVLLTITNIEIITITSLGVFVGALGLAVGFGVTHKRGVRAVLGGAALLWMVVGGYAAWAGGRVLYGRASTDRSTFVRLDHPPEALRYMQGVRLDANLYESLLLTAKELERIKTEQGDLSRVLFGATLEWLERAYPESIMRGMPVWYDLGTSLRKSDGPWLIQSLQDKKIDWLFTHPSWESWPDAFQAYLDHDFRKVALGEVLRLYEKKSSLQSFDPPTTFKASNALSLIDHTASQIHVRTTRITAHDTPEYTPSPWGEYYGTPGSWTWWWDRPVRIVEGTLIAKMKPTGSSPTSLSWRIIADPAGARTVLSAGKATLSSSQPDLRNPFRVEPNGLPLSFEIEVSGDDSESVTAGWRDMRILHAGDTQQDPVPPGINLDEPAVEFKTAAGRSVWLRVMNEPKPESLETAWDIPFETWTTGLVAPGSWQATLSIQPESKTPGAQPIIMVLWYKSGRLEIVDQLAAPVSQGEFTVTGRSPESGGWLGIVVRPIEQSASALNAKLRVVRWSK
jgi:hypothetical protein